MKKPFFILLAAFVALAEFIAALTLLNDAFGLGCAAGLAIFDDRIVLFFLTHSAGLLVRCLSWVAACLA